MKLAKFLIICIYLSALPFLAQADDDISVSINGRSYACGGNGENIKYACSCEVHNGARRLSYFKIDRSTGETTMLRVLENIRELNQEGLDICNQAKLNNLVCQSI